MGGRQDHPSLRLRMGIGAALAAVLMLGGFGAAWTAGAFTSSIPAPDGSIAACYPTQGSLKPMYLVDTTVTATCPNGFSMVTLNQHGQPGPTGATGATGVSGTTGASGPGPVAYVRDGGGTPAEVPANATAKTIDTVTLPAGNFLVDIDLKDFSSASNLNLLCNMFIGTTNYIPEAIEGPVGANYYVWHTKILVSPTASATFGISCTSYSGKVVDVSANITALKLSDIVLTTG